MNKQHCNEGALAFGDNWLEDGTHETYIYVCHCDKWIPLTKDDDLFNLNLGPCKDIMKQES